MAGGKLWTEREDRTLVKLVKEHCCNKEMAFTLCSQKIKRSPAACSCRWYRDLSNPNSPKYRGVIFTMISKNTAISNRTSDTHRARVVSLDDSSLWSRIKSLFRK